MINVIFFIGSLYAGGTEAKLARNFLPLLKERNGINTKLLLLKEEGQFLDVLPQGIEKYSLNETGDDNLFKLIPRFLKAVEEMKADVVVSCMWYPAIITYLSKKFGRTGFRHIVHDTTNMTEYIKYEFREEKYRRLKLNLIKRAYRDAECVTVVSYGEKEDLVDNFGIPGELVEVIYNPINIEKIHAMSDEEAEIIKDKPVVVSVGRLVFSKGFDVLLKAFQKVREKKDCRLIIIGTGTEKERLEALRDSLNLHNDVTFLGFRHNPFKYMKCADLFCSATRYEGLGNTIIEAMALGLPVIATDCRSGPPETLDNGKYGILVSTEDHDALAAAMLRLLDNHELRKKFSALSLQRSRDYSIDKLLPKWEKIITKG